MRLVPPLWVIALSAATMACTKLAGLDRLQFVAGSGGAGGEQTGGSGGAGGEQTGGSGGSAGSSGGGGEAPPCHPPGLTDNFSGTELDATLWDSWTDADVTVGVAQGVAFVHLQDSSNGTREGAISSDAAYDLTSCSSWIEVVSAFDNPTLAFVYFHVARDDDNSATISILEGEVNFRIKDNATLELSNTVPYSASEHRWLRIRDRAGTLELETSSNGESWNVGAFYPTPAWIDRVAVGFGAGTWNTTASPGRAEFDNLNSRP